MTEKLTYSSPKAFKDTYSVSNTTLRRWSDEKRIRCLVTPAGRRRYCDQDVANLLGAQEESELEPNKKVLLYARVSSKKQEPDLSRQVQLLKKSYPDGKVYRDTASGLNYKRKGLTALLERVNQGDIGEVVVTSRDRLARYGVELIELMLKQRGAKLTVVLGGEEGTQQEELATDLLAICNYFVSRHNGRKGRLLRQARKQISESSKQEEESEYTSEVA